MKENKEGHSSKSDNVIDFVAWKNKKLNLNKTKKMGDYFKILNFNELLNESNIASSELASKKPSFELILKVDILLKEFQKRLQKSQAGVNMQLPSLEGMVFILEGEPLKDNV